MRTLRPSVEPSFCNQERRYAGLIYRIARGRGQQHADAPHPLALLRARRERPSDCCAAEKGDELAPPHGFSLIENHTLSRRRMNEAFCITANLAADGRDGSQCDIGILFDDVVNQGQQGLAGASCVHPEIKGSHRPITKIGRRSGA
jgi:hypothetical protein